MDSRLHWLGVLGYEMTFEKAGCEIKKEHKKMKKPAGEWPPEYVQKLILEKMRAE